MNKPTPHIPPMTKAFVMEMAGGREKFAELFGIEVVTSYAGRLDAPLQPRKAALIANLKPEWAKEWERRCRVKQEGAPHG